MGSSFLFYEDYLYEVFNNIIIHPMPLPVDPCSANVSQRCGPNSRNEGPLTGGANPPQMGGGTDVWNDKPTTKGIILYSIMTTIICSFGIFGNALSLKVLRRKELTGSVYTYLAAAISSLSVMATVAVTIDRVLFLWHPVQCTRPRFCNPRVARKLMTIGLFLAIVMNSPYCFIFKWDERGQLRTSQFFHSSIYTCFNWFMLIVLTIIPCLVLILGNGFLIMTLQKSHKITSKCNGKRRDHTNLTIILISIIILFLISEIPSNMVSRMKANSLLFGGDPEKINSRALEITRQICTLLGALNVTINFLFYYLFCPAFCRALMKTIKRETKKKKKRLSKAKVNVFVVQDFFMDGKTKILGVARHSIEPPGIRMDLSKSKNTNSGEEASEKKIGIFEDTEYVEIIDSLEVRKVEAYSSLDEGSFDNESTAIAGDY